MDKPDSKGPNDGAPPLNSGAGRVRSRPAPAVAAPSGTAAPQDASAVDGDSGASVSSPRAVRRRRTGEGGVPAAPRPGAKLPPSSLATGVKPGRRRTWLRWLNAAVALLLVAGAGGLAWWHLVRVPREAARVLGELAEKPTPAPKPLPAVPAPPPLFLPARPKADALPRAYRAEALGLEEPALRKQHPLEAPPKTDPWCDGFRPLKEPLVTAAGYKFAAGKLCELAVRYARDCPYSGRLALERAVAVYGKPTGQYNYRAGVVLHTVQFWDDGRTMLKLDSRQEGPETRLHALQLLDKATSLERAVQK